MTQKTLFYSNVKNMSDFETSSFYTIDIKILSDIGYEVIVTNKVSQFCKFWKYDIAFIYFYRMGFLPGFIAKLFGKKTYYTGGIDDLSPVFASTKRLLIQRILFALCYWVSTLCVIVSKSDLDNIGRFWKLRKKLVVIPHVISVKNFDPNVPKQNIITSICWMGSIDNVKRKGVDQLIRGFSIFKQSYPSFRLCIIGRHGPGYDYLRQVAEECNVDDMITFSGAISDIEKATTLSKSKYYGQLSKFEGFGIATLEAMASSCIMIHSGHGGLNEIVREYGAIVTDIEDPEAIAKTMIKCELELEEYQHRAIEGCENIRMHYDYSTRYSEFKKILS